MSNDTAAFLFIPGLWAQSTQQRKICCCRRFFTPQKGRRSTDFRVCRPVLDARRTQLIYQRHIFCAIDISVQKLASGLCCTVVLPQCMQRFHVLKWNVYKIIAKFDVPPMMHPSFLCKMAKYTCCTVFRAKFIHFSKGVNSCAKTRAIFVRFLFGYLQFASFFLAVVLLS